MASPHGAGGGDPCAGAAMGGMTTRSSYFKLHKPDKWDEAPLILVESPEMRAALGMEAHQKRISPLALSQAEIEDPQAQAKTRFTVFVQRLAFRQGEGLSTFERNVMQVADRLWAYQEHRMGRKLAIVPLAGSESQEWLSAAHLLRAKFDERTDPTGELRKVQEQLQQVRTAYQGGSAEAFQSATAALFASLAEAGPQLGDYPATGPMTLEAAYNRWTPFRFAWVLTLLTCLGCTLSLATGWRPAYWGATAAFTAGLAAMLVGFAMRCVISGRAPVTNMYESVIYVGLGVAVFGLIMELVYRKQVILAAAAVLSTLALILADNCPVLLNPDLQPLNPILRNNYWLTTHVMSITLSYAAFALALGIGNVTLGYYLAGSRNQAAIDALSRFTYRTLQIGVVLLAVGTVLGGIWADYAWGRFWGWDPKEVWALISLLGYVSVLHAKHVNWVGQRGLAALAVGCFSLVIIAWYGVNFIIGTGLHSYGFGSGGGQFYVGGALLAQFLYVGVAVLFGRQESLAALPPTRPSLHLRRPSGAREPVAASQLD
jgi:cytochrome c-type biogenesis protein CcsB